MDFLPYINMNWPQLYLRPLPLHSPLPPPTPSHPSRMSQSTSFGFPASYSKLPQALCFTYGNVYVSVVFSHSILTSSSPPVPKSLIFMCVSPFLLCKLDHQYYLSRFLIDALIYDIYLSLSGLLHSV